ncbi:MAG: type II secretion system F family protein [Candidatus Omnitrophota bacterium]
MNRYRYTARNEEGNIVKGVIFARDEVELANRISDLGYFLTSFKVSAESDGDISQEKVPKLRPKEVLDFTIQLAVLINAGLPLTDGLRSLATDTTDERIQKIIDGIRYRVESGGSLREALSFYPQSFSKLYLAIIGAGESTGKLQQVLEDLSVLVEWQLDLKVKIKEAATYPVILSTVMVSVVILLVVKVIPTFEPIFEQAGVSLPLPTQIVLNLSHFLRSFWHVIIAIILLMFIAYKTYRKTERGLYNIDSFKLKLPLFGDLIRKIGLSRFAHTLALTFKSGINLLTCLDIARETCGNLRIERAIGKAKEAVNMGEKLSGSLQVTGEFPAMVIRMIGVGEESGNLVNTLSKVSSFYDKEIAAAIRSIFSLLEPIMIVIMGVVVGGIALSIFLPMFEMARVIGG